MSARLLMICLDGADGAMLDQYSRDGSLPNLTAVRLKGAAKPLTSPAGSTDDSLWASFQYALNVEQHGRYFAMTPQKNDRLGMAHENEDLPTFWDSLSRQGQQVAVLDVPKCRAPRPLHGIHLADWLTHGEYFDSARSFPRSLANEVLHRFGPRTAHQCHYLELEADRKAPDQIVARMLSEISMKRSAGLHYLNSKAWDLFCIAFSQLHCINHKYWDSSCIPTIEELRTRYRPIFEVLQGIDEAIGKLVGAAGTAAECVVFAPTDFEPNGSWQQLAPEIIARINARLATQFGRPARTKWPFAHRILGPVRKDGPETWWHDPGTWPCTILPFNDNALALRITASGRPRLFRDASSAPPDGALLDAIEHEFLNLRGDADAEQAVAGVTRPSASQRGPHANNLPDMLVHFRSGYFPSAMHSASIGTVAAPAVTWRKGNHRDGGFIIASGQASEPRIPSVQMLSDVGKLALDILLPDRSDLQHPAGTQPVAV